MRSEPRQRICQLLWLYFWLLILDGALRKWIFPGLSNPLLLVRDPVALIALVWGWPLLRQQRWWPWVFPLMVIGVSCFFLAVTVGHGDIPTAAYGARILLLQLPLIFLYGAVFDNRDVIRFAWALAWLSIPMTVLIVFQSNLPAEHIINIAPGGEGTSVFSGALDRFRPAGIFSFISGLSTFYTLAASAVFALIYGIRVTKFARPFFFIVAIALVVALPVSLSRSLLAGYLGVLVAVISSLLLSRTRLLSLVSGLLSLMIAIVIASSVPAFQQTSDAFSARWENAAIQESSGDERLGGGLGVFQNRFLSIFTTPLSTIESVPILGYGIGAGTNVGSQRLTGGLTFIVGEGSWEASIGELGLPFGLAFLLWRSAFSLWLLRLAMSAAVLGNRVPLIFLGSAFLLVLLGQLGQPTGLGFIVISAGLTLAACKSSPLQAAT